MTIMHRWTEDEDSARFWVCSRWCRVAVDCGVFK